MYLNELCLKCGKTISFQTAVPYSVDKVSEGWNLITDESTGKVISVWGAEIAFICSQDVQKIDGYKVNARRQKAAQIANQRGERTTKFKATTQKR